VISSATDGLQGVYAYVKQMANEEYHAETEHDSSSTAKMFRSSRKLYYNSRITKRFVPKPPSDEMRLGTAFHTILIEPHLEEELIVRVPSEVLGKNQARRGKAYDEFCKAHSDKLLVVPREYDALQWQLEAIRCCAAAQDILQAASIREHSIFWGDENGNRRKCRIDLGSELDFVIADLKTTRRSPSQFWRDVEAYGYHQQAPWYQDGFEALYGVRPQHKLIVVQNQKPYRCFVRTIPERWLELGRKENASTIAEMAECRRTQLWIDDQDEIELELVPPEYIYRDEIRGEPDDLEGLDGMASEDGNDDFLDGPFGDEDCEAPYEF